MTYAALDAALDVTAAGWREDERLALQVPLQVDVQAKYTGYIERQHEEIERQRRHETTQLPDAIDYAQVRGLSNEVRQKLVEHRPATLGLAARIPGVTPAAISLLLIHLKRHPAVPGCRRVRASRVGPRAASRSQATTPMQHRPQGTRLAASRLILAAWLGLVLAAVAGCGREPGTGATGAASPDASRPQYDPAVLRRGNGPEPDTLDPQLARTDAAFNILRDLFEGLTAVGPDGSAVPAPPRRGRCRRTASSTRSSCGQACAGRTAMPLVAADYVAGMRRLVDPATASPYAQIVEPVVNAAAIARASNRRKRSASRRRTPARS